MSQSFRLTRAELVVRDKGAWNRPDIYAVLEWSNPVGSGVNIEVRGVGETDAYHYAYYQGWTGCQFKLACRRLESGYEGPPVVSYEACPPRPPSRFRRAAGGAVGAIWRKKGFVFGVAVGCVLVMIAR